MMLTPPSPTDDLALIEEALEIPAREGLVYARNALVALARVADRQAQLEKALRKIDGLGRAGMQGQGVTVVTLGEIARAALQPDSEERG